MVVSVPSLNIFPHDSNKAAYFAFINYLIKTARLGQESMTLIQI